MRCKAKTKKGYQCKNVASKGAAYCSTHSDRIDLSQLGVAAAGAIIGNVVAPGIGGVVVGASLANLANRTYRDNKIMTARVFVSFDFDRDKKLKEFLIQQSRRTDSPFSVIDHSLKEAAPERSWETKANSAIKRSDVVIVMVGPMTYRAQGVLKEVKMARAANKKIVQVIGYKDGSYKPVSGAGQLYRWNWDNLKKILS